MSNNDEILLQAARAMAAKLPELEAEYSEKSKQLQNIATKINQYRTIIASAGLDIASIQETETKRATKGSCMRDIDTYLTVPMSVNTLQKTIINNAKAGYGISTLYLNLKNGEKEGRYINNNGMWSKV